MYDFPAGSPPPSAPQNTGVSFAANLGMYGTCKFKGAEAAKYLTKQKLPANTIEAGDWTTDKNKADKVAAAVLEWAKDHGEHAACARTNAESSRSCGGVQFWVRTRR
jgi:hypothetical protein